MGNPKGNSPGGIEQAFAYYEEHVLAPLQAKRPIYEERGVPIEGVVSFRDWEVMAAILVDDRGSARRSGADLQNHEVKSAKEGGSFEYQYHKARGVEKLEHDLTIEHLYVVYKSGYLDVDVYAMGAAQFREVGERWREALLENYRSGVRQRFRRNMPKNKVLREGRAVMRIRQGRLAETPG